MKKIFAAGFLSALMLVGAQASFAAPPPNKIDEALAKKNLAGVQNLLKQGGGHVDDVIRALLKTTQNVMGSDPDFSGKMLGLAGQYAPQISPPSVPAICADLRRIAGAFSEGQVNTPLFAAVVQASESFSKAPVVVSAGRPNQCEDAFIQIANLSGDPALLAMLPGMHGPGRPTLTVRPGIPPNQPTPEEKPSAD